MLVDLFLATPQVQVALAMQKRQVLVLADLIVVFFLDGSEQKLGVIASSFLQEDLVDAFVVHQFVVSGEPQIVSTE